MDRRWRLDGCRLDLQILIVAFCGLGTPPSVTGIRGSTGPVMIELKACGAAWWRGIAEPPQFSKNCYSLSVGEHFGLCNAGR